MKVDMPLNNEIIQSFIYVCIDVDIVTWQIIKTHKEMLRIDLINYVTCDILNMI